MEMIVDITILTLMVISTSAKPLILSAHEGDQVFIPCFNTPEARIFFWKIKDSVYPIDELPSEMETTSNGIIIYNTTLSLTGKFTCFTYEGMTTPREISTVHFVVQARGLSNFPQSCATFATAYTQCSNSPSATFNVTGSNTEISSFKCLNDKVNLTVTFQEAKTNSQSMTLTFTTCQSLPRYDNITDLYLNAVETYCTDNCTTIPTYFTGQCYQNLTSITIKETTYSLSVVWISPVCNVLNNDVIQATGWVAAVAVVLTLVCGITGIGLIILWRCRLCSTK